MFTNTQPQPYSFEPQRKIGENHEIELDKLFEYWYRSERVGMSAQRSGIDRVWTDRTTNIRYSVEYKADDTAARTGKAFIETVSVDATMKPGWAYTSCAQVLVYYIPPLRRVYLMAMLTLKCKLAEWMKSYPTKKVPNENYNTEGVTVPLTVFEKFCYHVQDFDGDQKSPTENS